MQKILPKGHTSCLSSQFKYTSATHTDLRQTFARVRRQLPGEFQRDRVRVQRLHCSHSSLPDSRGTSVCDERVDAAA
jgi:hypothetical protein